MMCGWPMYLCDCMGLDEVVAWINLYNVLHVILDWSKGLQMHDCGTYCWFVGHVLVMR